MGSVELGCDGEDEDGWAGGVGAQMGLDRATE